MIDPTRYSRRLSKPGRNCVARRSPPARRTAKSENKDFVVGGPVVGIVRRPDPIPCPNRGVGAWDMGRNGLDTERGIKDRQRRLDVDVLDRVTDGPEPGLVGAIEATYRAGPVKDVAVVIDRSGVGERVVDTASAAPLPKTEEPAG